MAAPILIGIFGAALAKGPEELIKNFDWSKLDVKSNERKDYLTYDLVPSLRGKLTNEAMKKMDEALKVAIGGTIKMLENMKPEQRSWDNLHAAFLQNPLLVPDRDQVMRTDSFKKTGSAAFKFDGSPDAAVVTEVETWFKKLVNDQDVLDSCHLNDVRVLAEVVAQTGATVDAFETFFYKNEEHTKNLIDIGVLRFPDIDNPYFKVYRIALKAWSKSERILMYQEDNNGITGDYNCRIYRPREDVIAAVKPEAKQAAVDLANQLFGF